MYLCVSERLRSRCVSVKTQISAFWTCKTARRSAFFASHVHNLHSKCRFACHPAFWSSLSNTFGLAMPKLSIVSLARPRW